jgi:hypothetical protein
LDSAFAPCETSLQVSISFLFQGDLGIFQAAAAGAFF